MAINENITVIEAAQFLPTIWSGYILHAYRSRLGILDRINRRLEADAKVGNTVKVNKITQLTVQDKAAETNVTPEANTEGVQTLTLDKWKYVAFKIDDIVRVQSHVDLRAEYTNEIGYALKKKQTQDVLGEIDGFSSLGTYGVKADEAIRLLAMQTMEERDVDTEDPDKVTWVLSPAAYYGWLQDDEVKNSLYSGSTEVIRKARLRELYGGTIWKSNTVVSAGGGHDCALLHEDGLTFAQQLAPRVKSEWVIENISQLVVADVIYGYTELRDEGGIHIKEK